MKKLGADHPSTLITSSNLAGAYRVANRLPEAIKLYEQVRDDQMKKMGPDNPYTLTTIHNLAVTYRNAKRFPEAIAMFEKAREGRLKTQPIDHPTTIITMVNLAASYRDDKRLTEAIKQYEEVRDIQTKKLGGDHPDTLTIMASLAATYREAKSLPKAIGLFEQVSLGIDKQQFKHKQASRIITDTIRTYEEAGQFDKAESWQRKWLAVVKEKSGTESSSYAGELTSLGILLMKQKKYGEAEPSLVKGYDAMKAAYEKKGTEGATPDADAARLLIRKRVTEGVDRLIQFYTETNKPDDVKKWQAEKARLAASDPKK